jgi:hypothetical protein
MDLNWFVGTTGMCDAWREGRKLLDRSLRASAVVSYRQMIEEKTRWFLAQLISNPNEFHHHIELSVCNLPFIVYVLTTRQSPGETYHVTHIWLRPKRW